MVSGKCEAAVKQEARARSVHAGLPQGGVAAFQQFGCGHVRATGEKGQLGPGHAQGQPSAPVNQTDGTGQTP